MKTVWKFKIAIVSPGFIRMPKGAQILAVQMQNDQPCVWAMVDPDAQREDRYFDIYGTGQSIPDATIESDRMYVGTFQDGPYVWHLFERYTPDDSMVVMDQHG